MEKASSSNPQIKDLDGDERKIHTDMEEASSSNPQIKDLEGEIKIRWKPNPQIKDLAGSIKIYTDMEASSSNPQIENPDDVLEKRVEERMKKSNVNIGHYRPLIRAIQEKDVKAQKAFLDENPDAMKSEIDEFGNTVFHLIVDQRSFNSETVELLKELVSKVTVDSPATLEILDVNGSTALDIAAWAGNTEAVKVFVEKDNRLLSNAEEAVHLAALRGRKETVRYLLSLTEELSLNSGALLLKYLIESDLHGIALGLLKRYPKLALRENNCHWNDIVYKLATKYRAFESGRKRGSWESLIYQCIPVIDDQDHVAWRTRHRDDEDGDLEMQNHKSSTNCSEKSQRAATFGALGLKLFGLKLYTVMWDSLIQQVPSIKRINDQKLMHRQTLEIVRVMISEVDWTYKEALERLKKPVLIAAKLGIHEFVHEVLKANQCSALFLDDERRNIFLLAISYRKEKVFSLIHDQMSSIRDYTTNCRDSEDDNILHLAAKCVPSCQVSGSALQMQRELQWFKPEQLVVQHLYVSGLFPSFLEYQLNKSDETPGEVFTREHKDLVEKGEKWVRDTATSCSVVAALIITIVFAAALTVPGGIDSSGIPNYLKATSFRIFAISTAIGLFSSTTSVQMFLGMLTSRYEEEDFQELLPRKLIIGLVTLFLSSSSMMVSFGAAFCIVLNHPWKWIIVLICGLGCIPIILFAWMQFPLLFDIFRYTYGPSVFKSMKTK